MAVGDFDNSYPVNRWETIGTNQRPVLEETLMADYLRRKSIYGALVGQQFDLGAKRTTKITMTRMLRPHANFDPTGLRTIWLPRSYMDSEEKSITLNRYSGSLSLHEWDDQITYWKQNGTAGLKRLVDESIGPMAEETLEMVARNTFFQNTYKYIGASASNTGFNQIGTTTDVMSTDILETIQLGMMGREVPFAQSLDGGPGGLPNIVCVTTPGVIQSIRREAGTKGWMDRSQYAQPGQLISGEIGQYLGVRFVQTNRAHLWNAGVISKQVTITAAIAAGDGAPDPDTTKVDGVYGVGQKAAARTHYIQCGTFAANEFKVNDYVTIHVDRTNSWGITNGVDITDGKAHHRRIVAVDQANARLTFDYPIMEDFNVNLGGGVYGYVTKAQHVHSALFVGGFNGVVSAVSIPPRLHTPPPIDDTEQIYRISWDTYQGYNLFEPKVYEVWYGAGKFRIAGPEVY
jgi:hypothetical protein